MYNTDIVIIDSGVDQNVICANKKECQGFSVRNNSGTMQIDFDFQDTYGHGTAVFNIVNAHTDASILAVRIFEDEETIDEEKLIFALEYIRDNVCCKIINLSLGLKVCENKAKLKAVCEELSNRGVIIVSAFDNDGCMSYPAAFDCVIGVGNSYKCKSTSQYEYVEGSPVNILAKGGLQRVLWNNQSIVMGGSSFACAHITAYVANMVKNEKLSFEQLHQGLRENASFIYKYQTDKRKIDGYFDIKRAAVFPINKEIHALIRNRNTLDFEIAGLYDITQTGKVGAAASKYIHSISAEDDCTIQDVNDLDFSTVDTLIIGHMDEINRMLGKDIRFNLVQLAMKNGVNVFSFDSLEYCSEQIADRRNKIYYPAITLNDIPQNTFGKMYVIDKPVVSVLGTSSQQGKFTLQLHIRDAMQRRGYSVGMIGTEPHSLLFGMDYVYPMGYKSNVRIDNTSTVLLLNRMINSVSEKNVDLIITGSQANTVPLNTYNVMSIPLKQHTFLMGVQPDAVVLCINPQDDIEYIEKTIKYIEGTANCEVVALALFPMEDVSDWRRVFGTKAKLSVLRATTIQKNVEDRLGISVYLLGEQRDMENLTDHLVRVFTCEGE